MSLKLHDSRIYRYNSSWWIKTTLLSFVDLLLWHLFPPNIEMYYLFYYSVLGWVRYLPKILVVREPTLELSYEADTMAALHSSGAMWQGVYILQTRM